jgi:cytidine diphosphoramidate kinase
MNSSLPGTIDDGGVTWITGLSGVGKTTVARALVERVRARGERPLLLDGDLFRELVGDGLGHGAEDRLTNALRLARFAREVASQGIPVVVATMSLFRDVHAWNRAHVPRLKVVYLHAPLEFLAKRDTKGLYAQALAGRRTDVVGVDLAFEPPPEPDLAIDVSQGQSVGAIVDRILSSGPG